MFRPFGLPGLTAYTWLRRRKMKVSGTRYDASSRDAMPANADRFTDSGNETVVRPAERSKGKKIGRRRQSEMPERRIESRGTDVRSFLIVTMVVFVPFDRYP